MNQKAGRTTLKGLILATVALTSSPAAFAEYELYKGDYGELAVGLHLQNATFLSANVWIGNADSDLDDTWAEFSIEPSIKGALNLPGGSQLYGEFSYLYGKSFGHDSSGLTIGVESDAEAAMIEQGYVGWRSGNMFPSLGENAIDISAGHQDYLLGSGFLLYDGGNDGGERGAWWLGARTAFKDTVIARINIGNLKLEGFHLETRPRQAHRKSAYDGMNIEYKFDDIADVGFSYIHLSQDSVNKGANVYDGRINFVPLPNHLPNLSLGAEYVFQHGKNNFKSEGGYGQIAYHFKDTLWEPKITYRYTALQEDFNGMAYGFSDWGTWYQGEITGEHLLEQTNTLTHMLRLSFTPLSDVYLNLFYYHFEFDNPAASFKLGINTPPITASHYGDEFNIIADWEVNEHLLLTGAFAAFMPGEGAKQLTAVLNSSANKTWVQAMFYASFKF